MSGGGTIEKATEAFARLLLPRADALSSSSEILAWVDSLGWVLPSVPPSLAALSSASDGILDALTELDDARESGDDTSTAGALVELAASVGAFVSGLHGLGNALRAELPADFVTATGIADAIERRIVEDLVVRALEDGAPLLYDAMLLFGIVEQTAIVADPSHMQPDYLRRAVRLDHLSQLFRDPAGLAHDVYGWGSPKLDSERLFDALLRLSYRFLMPAEIRYPSRTFLQAAVPGVPFPTDGPESMLVFPLCVDFAIVPVPATGATAPQGVAFTILPGGSLHDAVAFGPRLSLAFDATLDVAPGLAAVLTPSQPLRVIENPESGTGNAVDGKLVTRVTYARAPEDTEPLTLLAIGSGVKVEADQVYFAGGITKSGGAMDLFIETGVIGGRLLLSGAGADGFMAEILPREGIAAKFDIAMTWSRLHGLHFTGSGGLETNFVTSLALGPLRLTSVDVALSANANGLALETSASGAVSLGPIEASFSRFGLETELRFASGNFGPIDLAVDLKPPSGVGLSIDAHGVVTGSGFLFRDGAHDLYAGAMQLSLHDAITVTAIGLIATRLPDGQPGYSLLIFITAEDFQPIQLGLGFTLTAIGGMVGVNRTFDETVLRDGLKTDSLSALLFPRDPAGNVLGIVRSLASAFPAKAGSYLLGLLARICWGTPTLIQFDLALILELGARTRLLALGRVTALLPTPDNDLVRLKLDAMGVLDFDAGTIALDAALVDSRVVHKFAITGAGAFRAGWGNGPGSAFVLAVGGFNPRFVPPAGVPALDRVTVALSSGDNPQLTCEAYFALTSNTMQFGARAQLVASAAGFSLIGDVGFDVLMTSLSHFLADFHASVQLKRGSHNLFKVGVTGTLEGFRPLRLSGKATFEILWCDFSVHFHATLLDGPSPMQATVDALPPLLAALGAPQNWRTLVGPTPHGVSLRKLLPGGPLVVDPLGQLQVTQSVLPLGTARDIDTLGGARLAGPAKRFALAATLTGPTGIATAPVLDAFAPGQYFEMSDDERLASPSFEQMQAGVSVGSTAVSTDLSTTGLVAATVSYLTLTLDGPTLAVVPTSTPVAHPVTPGQLVAQRATGAAAQAPVRRVGRARFGTEPRPAVTVTAPRWVIAPLNARMPIAQLPVPATTSGPTWIEKCAVLDALNQGGAKWQLVPAHELGA